jgi:hypothetical protein
MPYIVGECGGYVILLAPKAKPITSGYELFTRQRYNDVLITFVSVLIIAVALGVWQQFWQRTESFDVTGVFYRQPATSEVVPVLIQGSNFDRGKEIVITIGNAAFANADDQTLKVHGSTAPYVFAATRRFDESEGER